MMPDSGLEMTDAASRKVMRLTTVAPLFCMTAGFGLPASVCAACAMRVGNGAVGWAPVPVVLCEAFCSMTVSVEPSGNILSVS